MSPNRVRRLAFLVASVPTAYFVFWACAPSMVTVPPQSFPDEARTLRGAAVGGGVMLGPKFEFDQSAGQAVQRGYGVDSPALIVAGYIAHDFGPIAVGGVSSVGVPDLISAGLVLRGDLVETRHAFVGVQVQGGWLWADASLPLAVAVSRKAWVYTAPSIGWRLVGELGLPLGVSVNLREGLDWRSEVDAHLHLEQLGSLAYNDSAVVVAGTGLTWSR